MLSKPKRLCSYNKLELLALIHKVKDFHVHKYQWRFDAIRPKLGKLGNEGLVKCERSGVNLIYTLTEKGKEKVKELI